MDKNGRKEYNENFIKRCGHLTYLWSMQIFLKHKMRSYLNTEMVGYDNKYCVQSGTVAWELGNIIVLSQTFMNTIIINIL